MYGRQAAEEQPLEVAVPEELTRQLSLLLADTWRQPRTEHLTTKTTTQTKRQRTPKGKVVSLVKAAPSPLSAGCEPEEPKAKRQAEAKGKNTSQEEWTCSASNPDPGSSAKCGYLNRLNKNFCENCGASRLSRDHVRRRAKRRVTQKASPEADEKLHEQWICRAIKLLSGSSAECGYVNLYTKDCCAMCGASRLSRENELEVRVSAILQTCDPSQTTAKQVLSRLRLESGAPNERFHISRKEVQDEMDRQLWARWYGSGGSAKEDMARDQELSDEAGELSKTSDAVRQAVASLQHAHVQASGSASQDEQGQPQVTSKEQLNKHTAAGTLDKLIDDVVGRPLTRQRAARMNDRIATDASAKPLAGKTLLAIMQSLQSKGSVLAGGSPAGSASIVNSDTSADTWASLGQAATAVKKAKQLWHSAASMHEPAYQDCAQDGGNAYGKGSRPGQAFSRWQSSAAELGSSRQQAPVTLKATQPFRDLSLETASERSSIAPWAAADLPPDAAAVFDDAARDIDMPPQVLAAAAQKMKQILSTQQC